MHSDPSELIRRRHPEWREHQNRWRWLLDSYEGGDQYRQAVYGYDPRGLPVRNLVRHKREYPTPGEAIPTSADAGVWDASMLFDPLPPATDDDYELRRARTPVPTFVAEAVETHLSRIYAREVRRTGPEALCAWWADIDGAGTPVDHWMAETVAPLLLVLGQLDVYLDHPALPEGETVETRADVVRLGLDRCVASVILPQDMLWWRLDPSGRRYVECLVLETSEIDQDASPQYRHWTEHDSTLLDTRGRVLKVVPHPYGQVPIVRLFDRRRSRDRNVGQSRYEGIAERQREYYNRDSELILSDTTQAHPLLQGPEDYISADGTLPIGPSWLLPKKKNTQGGAATYEGFDVVDFPKDGAESIRRNKADLRDDIDRDSALVRPSGRDGAIQSGIAKLIDHADGNFRLAKLAKVLARVEHQIADLAWTVLGDGPVDPTARAEVAVVYPADFDLFTATDVAEATRGFQTLVAQAGALPLIESLMLGRLMRLCLPGLSDDQYALCEGELEAYLARRREHEATALETSPHRG
jgi:hypothetical protein